MTTKEIKVTKQNIDNATRRNAHKCMIADAVKETYPNAKYIHVGLQSIRFSLLEKGERYQFFTPKVAQLALLNFDQGKKVRPFAFTAIKGVKRKVSRVHRGGTSYKKLKNKHPHPVKYREYGLCYLFK